MCFWHATSCVKIYNWMPFSQKKLQNYLWIHNSCHLFLIKCFVHSLEIKSHRPTSLIVNISPVAVVIILSINFKDIVLICKYQAINLTDQVFPISRPCCSRMLYMKVDFVKDTGHIHGHFALDASATDVSNCKRCTNIIDKNGTIWDIHLPLQYYCYNGYTYLTRLLFYGYLR